MGLDACSMELLVGFGLADPGEPGRMASGAAGAGYGSEYEAKGNVPGVPGVPVEIGVESLAGAELHQILDAAGVAAVVSRDGDDASRVNVSISRWATS